MFLRNLCAVKAKHKPLLLLGNYFTSLVILLRLCLASLF